MSEQEFTVDVTITATIRVKAPDAASAIADVREIQAYELNATFDRGRMVLTEISVDTDTPSVFTED